MNCYSKTSASYDDYLMRLIFGSEVSVDPISVCIDSAYRDFCRTLRGIRNIVDPGGLHADAVEILQNSLSKLRQIEDLAMCQERFDE